MSSPGLRPLLQHAVLQNNPTLLHLYEATAAMSYTSVICAFVILWSVIRISFLPLLNSPDNLSGCGSEGMLRGREEGSTGVGLCVCVCVKPRQWVGVGDFISAKLQLSHRIPLIRRTCAASTSCETRAVSEDRSPSTVRLITFSVLLVTQSSATDQQDYVTLVSNCLQLEDFFIHSVLTVKWREFVLCR